MARQWKTEFSAASPQFETIAHLHLKTETLLASRCDTGDGAFKPHHLLATPIRMGTTC